MSHELTQHWRKLYENKYMGAWNLFDDAKHKFRTATVVIESARIENVVGEKGRKSDCLVLRFRGKQTPMILSRKNGNVISSMHGKTPSEWIGKTITLWVEENVRVRGDVGDVLRVRNDKAGAGLKAQLEEAPQAPELFGSDEEEPAREPGEEG
jgi:hypothetical protein